jgi:hypothetical protein
LVVRYIPLNQIEPARVVGFSLAHSRHTEAHKAGKNSN